MKIALVNNFDRNTAAKLLAKGIDTVIYVILDPEMSLASLSGQFNMINMYDDFPRVSEFSFALVRKQLSIIKKNIPGLFVYQGYDLTHALEKDVFWGTLKRNGLYCQLGRFNDDQYELYDLYSRSRVHKWLALCKRLFAGRNSLYQLDLRANDKVTPDMVGFRINEFEMIELYGNLITTMPREKMFSFQNIIRANADEIHERLNRTFQFNIRSRYKYEKKNTVNPFQKLKLLFLKLDSDFLNVTADSLFKLINHVEQYERLMQLGVKKLMIAAAENEGEGNVVGLVAKKHGCTTYNYMNGAKARDSHNIHTYFDYWCMPDQATKDLILSFCDVRAEQLPVTGHLLEEKAREHRYAGTLDNLMEHIKDKKVISVFSSPAFLTEQMEVMNFLNDYLNHHEDVVVLIRKHPADRREKIANHPRMFTLPAFESQQMNITLFDLFKSSSASISFSSTVSLQSSWFDILTVNFEYAKVSMLTYVDNKKIMLANSSESLKNLLDMHLLDSPGVATPSSYQKASETIVTLLTRQT